MSGIKGWFAVFLKTLEKLLIPIAIAGIGFYITIRQMDQSHHIARINQEGLIEISKMELINTNNNINLQINTAEVKAKKDNELKLLEIYEKKLFSSDPKERNLAISLIKLSDTELSQKIETIFSKVQKKCKKPITNFVESGQNNKTVPTIIKLSLNFIRIDAIEDGSDGGTTWKFSANLIRGEFNRNQNTEFNVKEIKLKNYTFNNEDKNKTNPVGKTHDFTFSKGEYIYFKVKGQQRWRNSIVAIGQSELIKFEPADFPNTYEIPVAVPGFPEKGRFIAVFEITEK